MVIPEKPPPLSGLDAALEELLTTGAAELLLTSEELLIASAELLLISEELLLTSEELLLTCGALELLTAGGSLELLGAALEDEVCSPGPPQAASVAASSPAAVNLASLERLVNCLGRIIKFGPMRVFSGFQFIKRDL